MYGLEKGKKPKKFDFDLELEIKKNPARKKELLKNASQNLLEIKSQLRKPNCKNSKKLSSIAEAYDSLKKVINKIT